VRIVVCIKQVPSSETKVRVSSETGRVDTSEVEWVINPYDEYALETALRIREAQGSGEVSALTLGPERSRTALRTALAMGCDSAAHVQDDALEDSDPLTVGRALAAAIKREPFDLVLCGKQAIDDDYALVPQAIAHFLDIPHVAVVPEVELAAGANELVAHREVEGATELVKVGLPCLVTIQKGKFEPRYPTLKLMMAAKRKEIPVLGLSDLGLDAAGVTRGIQTLGDRLPPGRKPGRKLEGEPAELARELVRLLHEEAKVV
jgi:electron transfer flavoprotein beta subunit